MPAAAPPAQLDLSIILINWRMGKDVEQLLPCIEKHRHRCTFETILVNKPSEDQVEDVVRSKHPWVRLIEFDTFGIAVMRNVGLAAAKGRYCLILDADTELLPGCLDALVDFMDAHPTLAGCGGHTTRLTGEVEFNVKRFYDLPTVLVRRSPLGKAFPNNPWNRRHLMMDKDHEKPFYGDWMAGACFCMRREAIEQIGLFDQSYYFGFEDVDWCWRAKNAGWKIAFNPRARIIHKVQRLSDKGWNKLAWEHLKSGVRFWWKVRHQGMNWAWPTRPIPRRHLTKQHAATESDVDLTVIVVNYNAKKLLHDCMKSLEHAAPRHRMQAIVIDNASSDGSGKLAAAFPGAEWILNDDNLGFTKANNQGIARAKGRYVMLLNNDTKVLPGAFSDAIDYLDSAPRIGAAGLQLLNADGSRQLSCRRFPSFSQALFSRESILTRIFPDNRFSRNYLMSDISGEDVQDVDWVSGACLIARREVLDAIGGLDERFFMYSEDVDFCFRVWDAGWRVTYLPFAKVVHYVGQSSKKKPLMTIVERHRSMYQFYKKHYSRDLMFVDFATAAMVWLRGASHAGAAWMRGARW